jgi:CheY-like chemotaxis protein
MTSRIPATNHRSPKFIMKILIVDDNESMRLMLRKLLVKAGFTGHTFAEAEDGKSAYDKVCEWQPDLVLSDWVMPGAFGPQLLVRIRETGNAVPFVFVTGVETEHWRETALANGAVNFISKPYTPADLRTALADIIPLAGDSSTPD